jgi:hypothetical protein
LVISGSLLVALCGREITFLNFDSKSKLAISEVIKNTFEADVTGVGLCAGLGVVGSMDRSMKIFSLGLQ